MYIKCNAIQLSFRSIDYVQEHLSDDEQGVRSMIDDFNAVINKLSESEVISYIYDRNVTNKAYNNNIVLGISAAS